MMYDLFEHRHRFAVWAAARAAQRGWKGGSVETLAHALEHSGVKDYVRTSAEESLAEGKFDDHHKEWCDSIVRYLTDKRVPEPTYGRAAKLVAVYLKTMVVIGPGSESGLAKVAHPPVDGILLDGLAHSEEKHKHPWRNYRWTKLDEEKYYKLISELKAVVGDEPFWTIARYWTGYRE